jgi:hypothetical protein
MIKVYNNFHYSIVMITDANLNKTILRDVIQDCNINFLFGSGMSTPYLSPLGGIEELLSKLEKESISDDKKKIIRVSLYKKYFDNVISKNIEVLDGTDGTDVLSNYSQFLNIINSLLSRRKSTLLCKQTNIFTTNLDIFLEKALEDANFENNDGFSGKFNPFFDLSNFNKSFYKKSLHYDNISELPVFNLIKLHGALTWRIEEDKKNRFSSDLNLIKEIKGIAIPETALIKIEDNGESTLEELITQTSSIIHDPSIDTFIEKYEKLSIVNPTKEKFRITLLNQIYYELLRIYSNELEKENTVLFVMGFSFADEHIKEITLRAANSNPTLIIYIFARSFKSKVKFEQKFDNFKMVKNNNIKVITPPQKTLESGMIEDEFEYSFKKINEEVFDDLLKGIQSDDEITKPIHEEQ